MKGIHALAWIYTQTYTKEHPRLVRVHFCHELLRNTWPMALAVVLHLAKHFNLPLRELTTERDIAYRFGFRVSWTVDCKASSKG